MSRHGMHVVFVCNPLLAGALVNERLMSKQGLIHTVKPEDCKLQFATVNVVTYACQIQRTHMTSI